MLRYYAQGLTCNIIPHDKASCLRSKTIFWNVLATVHLLSLIPKWRKMENPRVRINLLTDSRGRDIETRLLHEIGSSINSKINFNVYPGATLEKLKNRQTRGPANLTVIIGGICNFTRGTKKNRNLWVRHTWKTGKKGLNKKDHFGFFRKSRKLYCIPHGSSQAHPLWKAKCGEWTAGTTHRPAGNQFIKEESEKRNIRFLNLAKPFYRSSRKRRGKERKPCGALPRRRFRTVYI